MKLSKLTALLLAALLALGTMPLMGCGGKTIALSRTAAIIKQGARAYKSELNSLKIGGVIDQARFDNLDMQADQIISAADGLADYLTKLDTITPGNKAELLAKIADGGRIARGILQNPRLVGLPADSTPLKVLNIAIMTLDNTVFAITALGIPDGDQVSFSSLDAKTVSTDNVKIKLPDVPSELQHYFK